MRHRAIARIIGLALLVMLGTLGQQCVTNDDPGPGPGPGPGSADPPPTGGQGTLVIMVLAEDLSVIGYRYAVERPDAIGKPTIDRSAALQEDGVAGRVLHAYMQVRLFDDQDNILSGQFIEDPFIPFVEVPADLKGEGPFWTKVDEPITAFLVAVPNIKGIRTITFTRFNAAGDRIDAGRIDLQDGPINDKGGARKALKAYDAADAEHDTLISNGPSDDTFDLLILSEGFQNTNADRALFNQKVNEVVSFLWSIPIYFELRSVMNVHTAYLPSVDAGADHPGDTPAIDVDTPFEAYFDCNDIDRLICLTDDGKDLAFEVAEDAPGNYGAGGTDAIMVLVNDPEYGGGGGAVLTSSIEADAPEIASHEFGHAVVDLADEYEDEYDLLVESSRTKVNISGEIDDANDLKWISLVDPATAIPTDVDPGTCVRDSNCSTSTLPAGTVGMYEGGGYSACESYRPTTECQMRCYVGFFCPVCRKGYRDVFDDFPIPTVDVYMRDNSLDVGNTPSPTNVEDPPGSGHRVKPWHSVDIRVDAPPFGGTDHENPRAGETNRIFITVHNRGSDAGSADTNVDLFIAGATGGAPPFPGTEWVFIGEDDVLVPGQEGSGTVVIEWAAPANAPQHTCAVAIAGTAADPQPAAAGGLTAFVRDNNNVTWKNLHVVQDPLIEGEISNFDPEPVAIVLRIEAPDVPVDTGFFFTHDNVGGVAFQQFEPNAAQEMPLTAQGTNEFEFSRTSAAQQFFSLRGDLPGAENDKLPFRMDFSLKVAFPGGTPTDVPYTISVDQLSVDPATGILGDPIGGNTYTVSLD